MTTSFRAYFEQLSTFDWFYTYSDDFAVYKKQDRINDRLLTTASRHPACQAMYDAWKEHHFSGTPWGTDKSPRPELEQFRSLITGA